MKIYQALGMKRAPCYKTIQNTMAHLDEWFLAYINRLFLPNSIVLGGIDSSGLKTHRKGAWIQIRFQRYQQKKDFKKVHIFVDVVSKKIIHCLVTKGTASDHKQLKNIFKECDWIQVDVILSDKGYDTRECFTALNSKIWKLENQSLGNHALCHRSYLLQDETTIRRIFLQH